MSTERASFSFSRSFLRLEASRPHLRSRSIGSHSVAQHENIAIQNNVWTVPVRAVVTLLTDLPARPPINTRPLDVLISTSNHACDHSCGVIHGSTNPLPLPATPCFCSFLLQHPVARTRFKVILPASTPGECKVTDCCAESFPPPLTP